MAIVASIDQLLRAISSDAKNGVKCCRVIFDTVDEFFLYYHQTEELMETKFELSSITNKKDGNHILYGKDIFPIEVYNGLQLDLDIYEPGGTIEFEFVKLTFGTYEEAEEAIKLFKSYKLTAEVKEEPKETPKSGSEEESTKE